MAFLLRGDMYFAGGLGLEYNLPEHFAFPSGFEAGEGLQRSLNNILRYNYGVVSMMCNVVRQRHIVKMHGLDLPTHTPAYTVEDVKKSVYGAGGLLQLIAQINYLGAKAMPILTDLETRLTDMMGSVPLRIPDEDVGPMTIPTLRQQEFAELKCISEEFILKPGLETHRMNVYLEDHYKAMAKLYNKVLTRRQRQYILPDSYISSTNALALSLKEMKKVAVDCTRKVDQDGAKAFSVPQEFLTVNGVPVFDAICWTD